jgi:hypothetical protein
MRNRHDRDGAMSSTTTVTGASREPEVASRALGAAASLNPGVRDYVIALACSVGVVLVSALVDGRVWHSMLVPIALAGALAGADVVRLVERRLAGFDPQALLGVFASWMFVFVPILTVAWTYPLPYAPQPRDLRPWIERVGWYNVVGLIVFRLVLAGWARWGPPMRGRSIWKGEPRRLIPLLLIFAGLALVTLTVVVIDSGGVREYIDRARDVGPKGLQGYGWALVIGESFGVLVMLATVMWIRARGIVLSTWATLALLVGYGVLTLATAGLRGSRANFVYAFILAVGLLHFFVRRISGKLVVVGIVLGIVFMFAYGFYKDNGLDVFEGELIEAGPNKSLETVLLGNFGRTSIQATELWALEKRGDRYRLRGGSTYVSDVALHIPRALIGERPETKSVAGTYLIYGQSPEQNGYPATYTYGLLGEWALNFRIETVPIAFGVFALACAVLFSWCRSLRRGDIRLFFVPLVGIVVILGLASDFDNVLFAALNHALLPGLALVLAAGAVRVRQGTA